MSATPIDISASESAWKLPSRGRVGMLCLIVAESAIFTIFVVAYIFYIGKSLSGPTPQQILTVPIFTTICLLSSSLTMHWAMRRCGRARQAASARSGSLRCASAQFSSIGTAREWHHLIYEEGFTLQTNLFGTTYYSLVGLHASHVIVGLIALTT